ncbi:DUF1877 family protein [Streptomyces sp. NPDC087219]|uniref:DUF1877 family protein n=1 Tax=unclassified Streptomyces TaxID=2593676 RepID=UPI00382BA6F2
MGAPRRPPTARRATPRELTAARGLHAAGRAPDQHPRTHSLAKAEIYPQIWDSPASLEWADDLFTPLTAFFQDAASAGHAMLIWID